MDFAGLEKLRIPKAIAKPSEILQILAKFGKPEQLDSSENVERPRTTRKRKTQKGNVDATQLQKAKNT